MKKTTVDALATDAGISKGAFYHFYPSKEHLFLDLLDRFEVRVHRHADELTSRYAALLPRERAKLVFRESLRYMMLRPAARFLLEEAPQMIRRLPSRAQKSHYQNVSELILSAIDNCGVQLKVSREVAGAIILILFNSLFAADRIGPCYDAALDALVNSACDQLIAD